MAKAVGENSINPSYARAAPDATNLKRKAPANTSVCEGYRGISDEPKV